MIQVERLERVVRANAVPRSLCRQTCALCGFVCGITAMDVGCNHEIIVILTRNNEKFRHWSEVVDVIFYLRSCAKAKQVAHKLCDWVADVQQESCMRGFQCGKLTVQ